MILVSLTSLAECLRRFASVEDFSNDFAETVSDVSSVGGMAQRLYQSEKQFPISCQWWLDWKKLYYLRGSYCLFCCVYLSF